MADASLPTLEQVMNGSNPFELIETPLGKMEKWRAETLLIGSTSGIQDVYRTIRDDAATQAARADELKLGTHSLNIYARRSQTLNGGLRTTRLALPQPKRSAEPMSKLHVNLRKSR